MEILINNQQKKVKFNLAKIRKIAQEAMKFEGLPENSELSIVFCDDDFIQKLNCDFLGNNRPTDVLSFPIENEELDNANLPVHPGRGEAAGVRLIGDIVISVETAFRQAEEFRHSISLEIVFLLIHALLHLTGYDHKKSADQMRMREREETICALLSEKKLLGNLEREKCRGLIKRSLG